MGRPPSLPIFFGKYLAFTEALLYSRPYNTLAYTGIFGVETRASRGQLYSRDGGGSSYSNNWIKTAHFHT